ncbi:unnamed protein product [Protopolystoma xenopodis]|uniref:Uncharacterized protein n=1 Tax=Protopolystoma xenopodis TaxID=117903 RepID=A0A3S5CEX5_9PLAT|nr:unnamed protein product [Protopolystoma xenopodis]
MALTLSVEWQESLSGLSVFVIYALLKRLSCSSSFSSSSCFLALFQLPPLSTFLFVSRPHFPAQPNPSSPPSQPETVFATPLTLSRLAQRSVTLADGRPFI